MDELNIFGKLFKEIRQRKNLTLRQFCLENNLDPGNISKLERGKISPPSSRKILEKYASHLGIREGTDDWYLFFDYAAACKGMIPPDILKDGELIEKLPLFFRTLRGHKISEKQTEALINLIRSA